MKYTYVYKSSDGSRHEASMAASSRDEVFALLRKRGIRPVKVVAADGAKANGELHGVRKRVLIATSLLAAAVAGVAVWLLAARPDERPQASDRPRTRSVARPLPRQVIQGDRSRIEGAAERIFVLRAERFLARFAEPGRAFAADAAEWPDKVDFDDAFAHPVLIEADELSEHIDLKRMVVGIEREMQTYLRFGGDVGGYLRELVKRQNLEISFREKAARRLKEQLSTKQPSKASLRKAYEYWIKANAWLQSMGIYPLPQPPELKGFQSDFDLDE